MRLMRALLLVAVVSVAAACSAGGGASGAPASGAPASGAAAGSPANGATRIEVTLTDALKITPATMSVPAGTPVTFVVTNTGAGVHEFVLGDQAEQQKHEDEMKAHGGTMVMDEPMGIGVDPGKTKELTVTFDKAGPILAACHISGHWAAGMQATVAVQ